MYTFYRTDLQELTNYRNVPLTTRWTKDQSVFCGLLSILHEILLLFVIAGDSVVEIHTGGQDLVSVWQNSSYSIKPMCVKGEVM